MKALFALMVALPGIAQAASRTDDITYHDNTRLWVLAQPAESRNLDTGLVESRVTYDATTATPIHTHAFGALQSSDSHWPDGSLRSSTDANGNTTSFGSYMRSIPQSIVFADAQRTMASVDALGLITSITDETGATTCHAFDAMGRLARTTYPGDTGACDDSWQPTEVEFVSVPFAEYNLPAGHWRRTVKTGAGYTREYFDAFWRPVVEVKADADNVAGTISHTITRYDLAGNPVFRSYPVRELGDYLADIPGMRTKYDALHRPVLTEQDSEFGFPIVSTTEYLTAFRTRTTNGRGFQTTTSYLTYDQPSFDLPVLIVEPEDTATDIVRDTFGKTTGIRRRDHVGSIFVDRNYTYDQHQRLCKTIEPEAGITVRDYDNAGNLLWSAAGLPGLHGRNSDNTCAGDRNVAHSANRSTTRTYDARNRLTTLRFADTLGDQDLAYTADGLLETATTWNDAGHAAPVVNTYRYNTRRLLVEERSAQPGWYDWALRYGYNRNGFVTSRSYPDGMSTLLFAVDGLGRTTGITDQAGNVYAAGVQYFANDAIRQFTYGNGIVHSMQRNARQLPARVTDGHVADITYAYDANANPTTVRNLYAVPGVHGGDRDIWYDGRDRLQGVDLHHMFFDSYRYDPFDNITARSRIGGPTGTNGQRYLYDAHNRLTNLVDEGNGATVLGLGYDAQGNLANKNGERYRFDLGNRLRSVDGKGAYRYDAHGRRVLAWSPAGNVPQMYDHTGALVWDINDAIPKATYYIQLQGSLIATREWEWTRGIDVRKFHHTDALGSPIAVTDQAGHVVERTAWEPYGAAIRDPWKQGVGFTGHVMDGASGLTHMQQRYYDHQLGRFVSVDPVAADTATGWNFNRYNYAANNPYKFKDPDGRIIDTVLDVGFIVYDVVQIARHGATATNMAALGADVAGVLIPGVTGGGVAVRAAAHADDVAQIAKVTAKQLRASGRADFAASKAAALGENGGKCNHCSAAAAAVGDHVKSLKAYADGVNAGVITKADAVKQANAPENIVGACSVCNGQKAAKELSSTPGPGKFVPSNPSERIKERL